MCNYQSINYANYSINYPLLYSQLNSFIIRLSPHAKDYLLVDMQCQILHPICYSLLTSYSLQLRYIRRNKILILKLSLQTAVITETANKDKEGIKATNTIPTTTGNAILVLYARNPTTVYRNIHQRNKRQKRLDLGPRTLIDLIAKPATLAISTNNFLVPIYSIQPKSRVKTVQVRTNQVTLLRLFWQIQVKKKSNTQILILLQLRFSQLNYQFPLLLFHMQKHQLITSIIKHLCINSQIGYPLNQ